MFKSNAELYNMRQTNYSNYYKSHVKQNDFFNESKKNQELLKAQDQQIKDIEKQIQIKEEEENLNFKIKIKIKNTNQLMN